MLFDNNISNIVRWAAFQYENEFESFWKAYTLLKKCIDDDNYTDVIGAMIDATFSKIEDRNEIKKRILTTSNLLRQWVDAVSRVYDDGAQRSFRRGKNVDEKAPEIYGKIKDLDRWMKEINRQVNLHNTVICYVRYSPNEKMFFLEIFDRDSCDVEYNPAIQDIVMFKYDRVDDSDEFVSVEWTRHSHSVKTKDGKNQLPENPEGINPYGIIPAIPIRKYLGRDFWSTSRGHGLVSATLDINFQNTIQAFTRLFNQFKMIYVSGGEMGKQTTIGPNKVVQIEIPKTDQIPTVGVLDMNIDFTVMQDTIEKFSRLTMQSYGVNDVSVSQPDNSGRAIDMRDRSTTKQIDASIPMFSQFEKDFFNLIRRMWNVHNPNEPISEETTINVTFGVQSSMLGITDLELAKKKMENGVMSPAAFFKMFNPLEQDDAAAEAALSENVQKCKEIYGATAIGGSFQPGAWANSGGGEWQQ